ncbi:MAG: hypothetical protein JJ926_04650 [Roseitalea sp.]|jgi:hypothetical protein|nr:DUF6455 family protein [Oceaniradius stylonematis]MBO6553093.1 hypothetical protein [Roseitalea sp.]MBO6951147.1 hypothetical protein [Rhizobiaceae bacterium]MBO6590866.1 hypothetical protein [Roseitalea sp.]MBO6599876.1 hypothetical protein [Roseitalea sp.]MBO6611632.1 hypothetical protein [Roseitalea sp.]
MSLLAMYRRMIRKADLMEKMIDTVDARDALQSRADHANVLRRAANRCMTCAEPDACEKWLAGHDRAEEAPGYCRNHDLFERLKHDIEAEKLQHA